MNTFHSPISLYQGRTFTALFSAFTRTAIVDVHRAAWGHVVAAFGNLRSSLMPPNLAARFSWRCYVAELMSKIIETTLKPGDSIRQSSAALNAALTRRCPLSGVSSQAASLAIRRLEIDAVSHFKDGIVIFQEVIDKLNGVVDPLWNASAVRATTPQCFG